jgi:hypothetical protein
MNRIRTIGRAMAVVMLSLSVILGLLGAVAWPPGGLMFALPYVFLFPAVVFALFGGALFVITRDTRARTDAPQKPDSGEKPEEAATTSPDRPDTRQ